jgi:hypothetical protein
MSKTKAKPKGTPDTRAETYMATLRVELTTEQVADRADREQKAAAKHAKSVIESLDAEIRKLSHEVRTKSTYLPVECRREWDSTAAGSGRFATTPARLFATAPSPTRRSSGNCRSMGRRSALRSAHNRYHRLLRNDLSPERSA